MQASLRDLVATGRQENKFVDFKGPIGWNDDKKFRLTVTKAALAFGNAPKGGWIVIGVEDDAAHTIVGLTEEQLTSYDTTSVNSFINNYADPPIPATLVKEQIDGRWVVGIRVPPFESLPHICKADASELTKCTIYVRDANNRCAPVSTSHELREILDRAVRGHQDYLLGHIRGILVTPVGEAVAEAEAKVRASAEEERKQWLTTVEQRALEKFRTQGIPDSSSFMRLIAWPISEVKALELQELVNRCGEASTNRKGWPFLYVDPRQEATYFLDSAVETAIDHRFGPLPRFDFWQLNSQGFFFHQIVDPASFINPHRVEFEHVKTYVTQALEAVVGIYSEWLEPQDSIEVNLRFLNFRDTSLCQELDGQDYRGLGVVCKDDHLSSTIRASIADLKAGLVSYAAASIGKLFRGFNFTHFSTASLEQWVRKFLERESYD